MEVREIPIPEIGEEEALLKVRAAGVCATDYHIISGMLKIGKAPNVQGHEICGEVVKGRQVGKTLGFPTANIEFPIDKLIPKTAVYATTVIIGGREYKGITNVGNAPTFNCAHNLIECHIDGFCGDLYGKSLKIYFDFFIRENKKFDCIDQLIEQLHDDLKVIR